MRYSLFATRANNCFLQFDVVAHVRTSSKRPRDVSFLPRNRKFAADTEYTPPVAEGDAALSTCGIVLSSHSKLSKTIASLSSTDRRRQYLGSNFHVSDSSLEY